MYKSFYLTLLCVFPAFSSPPKKAVSFHTTFSPVSSLTLTSANSILKSATNCIKLSAHMSWEPLLSGLAPNARGHQVIRSAGVNWNKTLDLRKILEIGFNYSESQAVRSKVKAHEARVSNDLIAFMLPGAGEANDNSNLGIPMEDLVFDSNREKKFDSIRPVMDGNTWGDDRMRNWVDLLKKDFFDPNVKIEAAKEMGFLEDWKEMLPLFEPGQESWLEHRNSDGRVYRSFQNLQFLILADGNFPFRLYNVEGKHRSIAMWSLALCTYPDSNTGTIHESNIITYDILEKYGIIKEGLKDRDYRDDVEDFLVNKADCMIRSGFNEILVYYVNETVPFSQSAKSVVSALNCISKLRSDDKTGSVTPKAASLLRGM